MSRYDVNAANTNRIVRFRVEAAHADAADAAIFGILKGRASEYPHYGAVTSTPTANQELAQLRTNLVVRKLTAYCPIVGLFLADDSYGTGSLTATTAPALIIEFEVDHMGVFFNNSWPANTTLDKHKVTDIADTVGTGGMTSVKTKNGLNSLMAELATVSYDDGVTGPFGALSATGNIVLPDGQTSAGAPTLDAANAIAVNASGLDVTFLPY